MPYLKTAIVAFVLLSTPVLADECGPCKIIATIYDKDHKVIEQFKYPFASNSTPEQCAAEMAKDDFKAALADLDAKAKQLAMLGFDKATTEAKCVPVDYKPVHP